MENPDNEIKTTHNLDFCWKPSVYNFGGSDHKEYKVGTCHGQWGSTFDSYYVLSVINREPGNGHLDDVFEWFEHSAKRDGKNLMVLDCENQRFYNHLLAKRGFVALDSQKQNVIKVFNQKKYKHLLKHGNEIIKKGTLTCV